MKSFLCNGSFAAIIILMIMAATFIGSETTDATNNVSTCPTADISLNDNDNDSVTTPVVGSGCTNFLSGINRSITSGSAYIDYYEVTTSGQENLLDSKSCGAGSGLCGTVSGTIASDSKLKVTGTSFMSGWVVVETDLN